MAASTQLSGFQRYLAAKKSVDDRALNYQVWCQLKTWASNRPDGAPLRILELGCGIGTMVERGLEWRLCQQASYLGIDEQPENIAAAWQRLPEWAAGHDLLVSEQQDELRLHFEQGFWDVRFEVADALDFSRQPDQAGRYDLLIAHAFLDLIDVPSFLPWAARLLAPGGKFYFTVNFDGVTILEPVHDDELEARIMDLYHQSMDERYVDGQRCGDSRSGRHLFSQLRAAGGRLLAAGASDWVVFSDRGAYPGDEAFFLHFILDFFASSLSGQAGLPQDELAGWLYTRREQIANGELVYIAHQLDLLGEFPQ